MSGTLCPTGAQGEEGCPRGAVCGAAEGSAGSCLGSLDVALWRLHRPPLSSSDSQAWSWTGRGVGCLWPPPLGTETPGSVWHMDGNRENCGRGPGHPGAEALDPCCPSHSQGPGLSLTPGSCPPPTAWDPGCSVYVGACHARGGLPWPHRTWACRVKGVAVRPGLSSLLERLGRPWGQ